MASNYSLRCADPPFFRFTLTNKRSLIGRSATCDLVVDEPSVSRVHAELRLEKSGIQLSDLGSRNGTFVDNEPVVAGRVRCGQQIRFGRVAFVLLPRDESDSGAETDRSRSKGAANQVTVELLSEAQRRVFDLLVTGLPEKAIAHRLALSRHTVHNHVRKILRQFGVHARTELMASLLVSRSPQ